MTKRFSRILVVVGFCARAAHADRGSIPFVPNVKIFEPTQRAMIAWNGEEEILLLSTDLMASRPTKVLEVLPLPSEPQVKKGDIEAFRKAVRLINSRIVRAYGAVGKGRSPSAEYRPPAGEVTFHKRIGAHDVSVTHVLDRNGFMEWVESYLRSQGVRDPKIPPGMKTVVGEYLRDGFSWFVFDVVSLETKPRTNDAIQYRFASERLFYPLRITRTESGETTINLLVLTQKLLSKFEGISIRDVKLAHQPVRLSRAELRDLNREMSALLGHADGMKLRIWRIQGRLSSFMHDLVAR